MIINLVPLDSEFSIYQMNKNQKIPPQFFQTDFYSITKTEDEISIVSTLLVDLDGVKSSHGWRAFMVDGIVDFSLTGLINDITSPLKANNISVYIISTFNTDYILVKKEQFLNAIDIFNKSVNIKIL